MYFNPRSPCGERLSGASRLLCAPLFQPTLPVRGATCNSPLFDRNVSISTHAPRAGSDHLKLRHLPHLAVISTHAPRAGSDGGNRRPAGGDEISTHAPRAGSDGAYRRDACRECYFNPRSPCGERRGLIRVCLHLIHISTHAPRAGSDEARDAFFARQDVFQPTLPVRGATASTNKFEALILYHKYNFGIIP